MDADTHRAMTLAVTSALGIEEPRSLRLAEVATIPDIRPDYVTTTYVTRTGRVRTGKKRATHHGTPLSLLQRTAVKARHLWLKGKEDEADFKTGRLLHYVEDGPVPSPKVDKLLHDSLERKCSRLDPQLIMKEVNRITPVGKMETFEVLRGQKIASTPEDVTREALKNSFAVASSIFSSVFAPSKFSALGRKAYDFFKSRSRELLVYSLLWISMLIPLSAGIIEYARWMIIYYFGLFTAFLVGIICYNGICMFIVTFSKDINRVLYKAQWIDKWIIPNVFLVVIGGLYHMVVPLIAIPVLLLVYFRILRYPAWRTIKVEVDWYRWI